MRYISFFNKLITLGTAIFVASCQSPTDPKQTSDSLTSANSDVKSPAVDQDPSYNGGDSSAGYPASKDPEKNIRARYSKIIQLKNAGQLDSSSFKYSCDGEKSGRVAYYSNQGKLKMISHNYNEYDHFTSTDQYFVEDNQPYFIYQNSVSWSFESGPEGSTKDNITERRAYFEGDKPFKCLEKKYTIHSKATNNPKSDQVSNKEVNCNWSPVAQKEFKLLARYYNQPAPACLNP